MGKYKEDAQDSVLRQMDKVNRRTKNEPTEDISLLSQLKKAHAYDRMSLEQKRAAAPKAVWERALIEFIVDKKKITTAKFAANIIGSYPSEVEAFHKSGVHFSELTHFFEEKSCELDNRNLK